MISWFGRLRERKLVQWALAYLAAAWLALEVFSTLRENLGWSTAFFPVLVAILAFGLPATLTLAWYHGEKGHQRVSGAELSILAVLLVIAAVVVPRFLPGATGGEAASRERGEGARRTASPAAGADPRAIAVLPFENFSPDPNDAYFANGMTEEITSQVARVGELSVVSRTAVSRALESDLSLRDIGRELAVGTILEGSVRKAAQRVRISAKLSDAATSEQLWSQDYDRDLSDVFALQAEVAIAIADALRAELTEAERNWLDVAPTENLEAYDLYLQQTALSSLVADENRRGIALLRRAVSIDPDFEAAWLRLSHRYQWLGLNAGDEAAADSAYVVARRVLEMNSGSPDAHYVLGTSRMPSGRLGEASMAFEDAIALDPKHADALEDESYLLSVLGEPATALEYASRALALRRNLANTRFHVFWPLQMLGDSARARAWLDLAASEGMEEARLDLARTRLALLQADTARAIELARSGLDRWGEGTEFERFALDVLLFLGQPGVIRGDLERAARVTPDAVLLPNASYRTPRANYALLLHRAGDPDSSDLLFAEALESARVALVAGSEWPAHTLEMAAIHAFQGRPEAALEWLDESYARGYREHWLLEQDPMFEPLRGNPGFEALLARMEAALRRERARVEAEGIAALVDAMIAAGAAERDAEGMS